MSNHSQNLFAVAILIIALAAFFIFLYTINKKNKE